MDDVVNRFARELADAIAAQRETQPAPRFVFVQPRVDRKAPAPPERGDASDQDPAIDGQARARRGHGSQMPRFAGSAVRNLCKLIVR